MKQNTQLHKRIVQAMQADKIDSVEVIQSLWSGYGELLRIALSGCAYSSIIVKHIQLPSLDIAQSKQHPKGWNSLISHQRKLKSYQVEQHWYQHYSNQCGMHNPVAKCLHVEVKDNEILLIIEDLASCGFPRVITHAQPKSIIACLQWLGAFHAQHMGVEPIDLWEKGTYWHLQTRPDEFNALQDKRLKSSANSIDKLLSCNPFQTLVHGDAKLANFCFSADLDSVAAVDFQYVGKGCGMKDVILLLSSVFKFTEPQQQVSAYLDVYFLALKQGINRHHSGVDADQVEEVWRPLYCVAWADFQRFVKGWSPEHWKINPYTESLTEQALAKIETNMIQHGKQSL